MRTTIYLYMTIALTALATAQDPRQIALDALDAMAKQDRDIRANRFASHADRLILTNQKSPGDERRKEQITAAAPGYFYTGINHWRVQETRPMIRNLNEMQYHVDRWSEALKFDGSPQLRGSGGMYQPARLDTASGPLAYRGPLLAHVIDPSGNGIDPAKLKDALRGATDTPAGIVATFDLAANWQLEAILDPGAGYFPKQITVTLGLSKVTEISIDYKLIGRYRLPIDITQIESWGGRETRTTNSKIEWLIGDQAPKLVGGQADYRPVVMGAFNKPVERPYEPGPPALFPLALKPMDWTPDAGQPLEDTAPIDDLYLKVCQSTDYKLRERFALLVDCECYKSTTALDPFGVQRWSEQRIAAQDGDRYRYAARVEINGTEHAWEELLHLGKETRHRSDFDRFPRQLGIVEPYEPAPTDPEARRYFDYRYIQLSWCRPVRGSLGPYSGGLVVDYDVHLCLDKGEMVAARQHDDGSIRTYWKSKPDANGHHTPIRAVIEHDPARRHLPKRATWFDAYPGQIAIEWITTGGLDLPAKVRIVRALRPREPVRDWMKERREEVRVFRWKIGAEVPDATFDADTDDHRAGVMDLFGRPFTRARPGQAREPGFDYKPPKDVDPFGDPPNRAPANPFGF